MAILAYLQWSFPRSKKATKLIALILCYALIYIKLGRDSTSSHHIITEQKEKR
jgi:hypothetical protein